MSTSVLVMGAGAIGCFVGGRLAEAGAAEVHFVARPRVAGALRREGLMLTDLEEPGRTRHLPAERLHLHEGVPAGLAPSLVLLCVKSGATAEAAAELAAALPPGTPVLSLQNGVSNPERARQAAPALAVHAGMVPFNVAEIAPGHYHRGSSGSLAAEDAPPLRAAASAFAAAGLPLGLHREMRSVQWGKLLLNLNNPVNALSGLPLRRQLLERRWRLETAALQAEALAALRAAGIEPARLTPVPPRWLPAMLRLPTPLFRVLAARSLKIDDRARSSMADDLALGRVPEIDALCGEVVRLAASVGLQAPRNQAMVQRVMDPAARSAAR